MTIERQMVPVEPTDEMIVRGAECLHDCGVRFEGDDSEQQQDIAESLYRAMIEAAPEPPNDTMTAAPVQQAEPVAWTVTYDWESPASCLLYESEDEAICRALNDGNGCAILPLYLHPPAAEVQRLVVAARAVVAAQTKTAIAIAVERLEVALEGVTP